MSMSTTTEVLKLRVSSADMLTADIRQLYLEPAVSGQALPAFTAGAHIALQVSLPDGKIDWREYSLVALNGAAARAPTSYQIAVRRETSGRGGSQFVHNNINVGDVIDVRAPRNQFPMETANTSRAVLIAGGIGVTPIASMAAHCREIGRPISVYYAGRSRALMAYLPELIERVGADLHVHADDEQGKPLDIAGIFARLQAEDHVYFCGPTPMIEAILATAEKQGWPRNQIHFELFSAPPAEEGDHPFEVELAQSGKTLTIPTDKSILDVLIDEGFDPLYDCKRGECGVCATDVLSGDIDHRDYILTAREKEAGNIMHTCVSRCKGSKLVLDM